MPSKYQPLLDHLAAATGDEVTLTFKELAALVGPLPVSAVSQPAWWTAQKYSQVTGWQALGWRARANLAAYRVRFVRLAAT